LGSCRGSIRVVKNQEKEKRGERKKRGGQNWTQRGKKGNACFGGRPGPRHRAARKGKDKSNKTREEGRITKGVGAERQSLLKKKEGGGLGEACFHGEGCVTQTTLKNQNCMGGGPETFPFKRKKRGGNPNRAVCFSGGQTRRR